MFGIDHTSTSRIEERQVHTNTKHHEPVVIMRRHAAQHFSLTCTLQTCVYNPLMHTDYVRSLLPYHKAAWQHQPNFSEAMITFNPSCTVTPET